MAKLRKKKRDVQQDAIIKVYNELQRKFVDVIIPSGITVGLEGDSDFERGIKMNGPLEFKTTTAPENTDMKMYAVGSSLYFNGSAVGVSQDLFKTFAVSGQSDVVADSPTDTMTLVAGSNMTITTDAASDSITFASSGGGGGGGWTDDGTDVRLTTATDKVGIGTASPGTKLEIEVADSENLGGLLIDFNETGGYNALKIDSESTSYFGASVYGKYGIRAEQDLSGGQALFVTRDIAEAGSYAMAFFHDDSTSNTQPTVQIRQDGTGDILSLYDGAAEVFTVLDGGKVGIGTSSPAHVLSVVGAVSASLGLSGSLTRLVDGTSYLAAGAGISIASSSNGQVIITNDGTVGDITGVTAGTGLTGGGTSGDVTLTIDDSVVATLSGSTFSGDVGITGSLAVSGSVGIGTVVTPEANLHVQSLYDACIYLEADTDNAGGEYGNAYIKFSQDNKLVSTIFGTVGASSVDPEGNAYTGTTSNSTLLGTLDSYGTLHLGTNEAVRMTIDTDGDVGIGTATPATLLEIEDGNSNTTLQISNTATTGDPQLAFALSGTKKFTMGVDDSDGDKFKLGTTAVSAGTVLTIDSSTGMVGFGTTDPAEALEVETGDAGQTTTTLQISNTAATGDPQLAFALSGTKKFTIGVDDDDADKLKIGTTACSTSTMLTIDSSGNVGIGTAAPSGSLDVKGDGSTSQVFLLSGSGAELSADESSYPDINFFVSGSANSKDSSVKGTALFGGDVVISGTLHGGSPLKISGGLAVTGTMELKPSGGGVAIVRNPHGPVKLFASSALKLGSNIGTIDLLDLGDGAAGQIILTGSGPLAERSVGINSPGTLFFTGSTGGSYFKGDIDVAGHILPNSDDSYNLGSESRRFANIYTGDLHLRNERGNWTIVEEEDYLCVFNNKNGKKYKMMLEPMDDE